MKTHFWYSASQDKERSNCNARRAFAFISGKLVEYTECRDIEDNGKVEPGGCWNDYVYLGTGKFAKMRERNS